VTETQRIPRHLNSGGIPSNYSLKRSFSGSFYCRNSKNPKKPNFRWNSLKLLIKKELFWKLL
jgi:hypothetical protein